MNRCDHGLPRKNLIGITAGDYGFTRATKERKRKSSAAKKQIEVINKGREGRPGVQMEREHRHNVQIHDLEGGGGVPKLGVTPV